MTYAWSDHDLAPCQRADEHLTAQRHPAADCPVNAPCGHCDTCGARTDDTEGTCRRDPSHPVALNEDGTPRPGWPGSPTRMPPFCFGCSFPAVRQDNCRYCLRYRRACGRHDTHTHEQEEGR